MMSQAFLCGKTFPVVAKLGYRVRDLAILIERNSWKGEIPMKLKTFLLVLMFALTSAAWAQEKPSQPPASANGPGSQSQMRSEHRQKMMEMHKQQMAAMKADVEKMKSSLAQMKTNVGTISDPAEKARWQANVDLWETMVGHMDQMQKHMESMGPGMMGPGMGGRPPSPPAAKPE
jgi:hypothetical protein